MSSSKENIRKITIDDLPDEVLEYILSLVSPYKDSDSCKLVSKRWCRTINSVNQHSKCGLYRSVLNSSVLWQCLVPPNLEPTTITKRYSHAACYCGVLLTGILLNADWFCSIMLMAKVNNCRVTANVFITNGCHHMFEFNSFMYVFGGCTSRCTTFNDLWTLDLSNRIWIRPCTTGSYPSPKACATLCCYNKNLVLFGGWTHPPSYPIHQMLKLFNELHIYDITSNKWTVVHSTVTPPPMAGHSATIQGNLMVVFGGLQRADTLFLYRSSNHVWCYNLETECWSQPETSDPKPKTRYGQSQIYLNDENILIMGGCEGPNSILDDVWLLTITPTIWIWKQIKVNNSQWAAPHLWCHPACRVGDAVVVFSRGTSQSVSHYSLCSTVQSDTTLVDASIPPEVVARVASQGQLPYIKDKNVNGQRGSLPKSNRSLDEPGTSSSNSYGEKPPLPEQNPGKRIYREMDPYSGGPSCRMDMDIQMAAFRSESTCSGSHSRNRMKQLECLRRMEEKYKNPPREELRRKPSSSSSSSPPEEDPGPSGCNNSGNRMNMYVVDISEVLTEKSCVSWRPPRCNSNAPREKMLHSLVLGKGELIIFGGVQKNSSVTFPVSSYKCVSNATHIITAPRNIV